jgi:hypothetical protein
MSGHTSTTTVWPLYVQTEIMHDGRPPLTVLTDRQPIRPCALRRCSGLRDWFSHHLIRCPLRILWSENGSLAVGQAHRERGGLREGRLVGSRQQGHDPRGEYILYNKPTMVRRRPHHCPTHDSRRDASGGVRHVSFA